MVLPSTVLAAHFSGRMAGTGLSGSLRAATCIGVLSALALAHYASSLVVGMSGYWYLGSPYSRYPQGLYKAHVDVCREAGRLIKAGIAVYSPIAHSHPIALNAGLDPIDHALWGTADLPLMEWSNGLIVLMMEGWDNSIGLADEIEIFTTMGLPVVYMEPGVIPEELRHER